MVQLRLFSGCQRIKAMKSILHDAERLGLLAHAENLGPLLDRKEEEIHHRDRKGKRYLEILAALPEVKPSSCDLDQDQIRIGEKNDLTEEQHQSLTTALRQCMPWRKGPFRLFGVDINSEWVSWLKWDRLKNHIQPLQGRRILDIGSSNGYYMFRMAAANPAMILGLEPYLTFFFQHCLLNRYAALSDHYCLPVKLDELPLLEGFFDTIFCMGVLYHHRSPHDGLSRIRAMLRSDGELVLETLIMPGQEEIALSPRDRYGKMSNVYFIPTVPCLKNWLRHAGFRSLRCIDITPTTLMEQRRTDWVDTESLDDFLDPRDRLRTVEGYPAPVRAILLANKR
ncbi:MAG: tRNA 5-methoxyuridine(34)/uridine 5-oxyacetic acid(34) synthase CmoB [Desulfuromonadaceae bacterium]|nr:tRNA 5-methoxyuridine(34)/uridine 5-oxyacetic acid(34) synthase CmoB [Desulfuromonadaceae bacterium]